MQMTPLMSGVHISASVCACKRECVHTCLYLCTCVCVCAYARVCVCVRVYACVRLLELFLVNLRQSTLIRYN